MKENNFILVKDNLLTNLECDKIIDYFKDKIEKETSENGINYAYFKEEDYKNLFFLKDIIQNYINNYTKLYEEFLYVNKFSISSFRFKHLKPGNFFKRWHSEHNFQNPYRIFCLQIYLSDHNCGTEFYTGKVILSKKGRGVIFPAYFTHIHKGQMCQEYKDRFLLSGYATFEDDTIRT